MGPIGRLTVVGLAVMLGGIVWSLWDVGGFVGTRYNLSGFDGLQALNPEFVANAEAEGFENDYGIWFMPTLSNWVATAGFVLLVASAGLGAALWRPRPRVASETATDGVTD